MASLTVENYLKAALQIAIRDQVEWISTGQLATALVVSPGTVTSMLKTLADSGLAEYRPYEGARLTHEGRLLALRMLRRHRLLELFLVRTLHLSWDQVHEEAENMEHAVSDMLIDRIDQFLEHPAVDPHGDPIPAANGEMRADDSDCVPLSSIEPGVTISVGRVTNQDPEFLRFLAEAGLVIGASGQVTQNSAKAGIVSAQIAGRPVALGHPAARQVLVRTGSRANRE